MDKEIKISIIGLGYVGLPLARLFATKYSVVGFDINQRRIEEVNAGKDSTFEVEDDILQAVLVSENPFGSFKNAESSSNISTDTIGNKKGLFCSSNPEDIKEANIYIVTVPTPVDKHNRPDLTPLYKASETVGKVLKKGDVVIYESTVYPGVTEEECIPVLEKVSGLKFNVDFFAGYSPERINPGDKTRTVDKILKVTSGSTPEIGTYVDELYKSVITAGTHLAPTIKVAEASKVIENSQRDINIAFVNELAKIFNLLDIDTHAVLEAAGTKWNFLPFKPGLVGGHCIGVDPFYLAQKAQDVGYYSELILTARRLNDSMGSFVASQVVRTMIKKGVNIYGAKILNLGITFKENCPDVRNTKAADVIKSLEDFDFEVTTFDPWANPDEVQHEYGFRSINSLDEIKDKFDAIVLTVAHQEFIDLDLKLLLKDGGVVYDVKGILEECDNRL
ncbi:nucleotide sugar dehydrogenase [Chryseobacterium sp. C-71]|uniref:nucleotide sugar dehydrogenase n=1 Tax=Chryseobacterium sp. C-71 TaxID=2893882 RepID=UPI001E4B5F1C|nr:nucleotide sugar dehydrogenase [Chryseobacterium sp. C-71]UFH32243.1 nucleotide sugar dehydrogenase [Chryseobacterium sp. C-71]